MEIQTLEKKQEMKKEAEVAKVLTVDDVKSEQDAIGFFGGTSYVINSSINFIKRIWNRTDTGVQGARDRQRVEDAIEDAHLQLQKISDVIANIEQSSSNDSSVGNLVIDLELSEKSQEALKQLEPLPDSAKVKDVTERLNILLAALVGVDDVGESKDDGSQSNDKQDETLV